MEDDILETPDRPDRLTRLQGRRTPQPYNPHYTRFVRFMRLALPLLALIIVAVVVAWPNMDKVPQVAADDPQHPQTGSNELVNPRYESEDDKGQPYILTATRAIQSAQDPDVVLLEKPHGVASLLNGTKIDAEAVRGAYRQKLQRLMLEGKVVLLQSQGYRFDTERLMIDMQAKKSWTDTAVAGDGPAGSVTATGMQMTDNDGVLIFTGPAKLILKQAVKGL